MARGKKSRQRPSRQKQTQSSNRGDKLHKAPSSQAFAVDRSLHTSFGDQEFTLRDAARFHQRDIFSQLDAKLRHRSITFVTSDDAGLAGLEGTIERTKSTAPPSQPSTLSPPIAPQVREEILASTPTAVEIDVSGSVPHRDSISSQSSEDVVIFSGRKQAPKEFNGIVDQQLEPEFTSSTLVEETTTLLTHPPAAAVTPPVPFQADPLPASAQREIDSIHQVPSGSKKSRRRQRQKSKATSKALEDQDADFIAFDCVDSRQESDDMLVDYIENMRESGALEDIVGNTEASNAAVEADMSHSLPLGTVTAPLAISKAPTLSFPGWNASDVEDFEDLSTSDEVHEVLNAILSKRERPSGLQYLVVWEGTDADEARWIHRDALTMHGAKEMIEDFEVTIRATNDDSADWTDDSGTGEDGEVVSDLEAGSGDGSDDENDDWHERDLEARRVSRMTDEQIARLLSKQEEFGLGSDDLVLFDGMAIDDSISEMDEEEEGETMPLRPLRTQRSTPHSAKAAKRKARHAALFAMQSDELFGEDYGDFDVMDHDRPSLIRERGGEPGSEAEFIASLQAQWEQDRSKKSLKKKEREELRAQGMLGKKKPDLSIKYKEGMSMQEVKHEIEMFLMTNGQQSCALPPLDKKDRKIVHEIAHAFRLKSKSAGSGKSRFPVLYKTSRTADFSEATFQTLQAQLEHRFFSRMDRRGKAPRRVGASGGGGAADVGYRHGDVVGASAPELGAENKGRAMLEKMGWSSGTALGALNNKGILLPVSHVVRKTRAGLG